MAFTAIGHLQPVMQALMVVMPVVKVSRVVWIISMVSGIPFSHAAQEVAAVSVVHGKTRYSSAMMFVPSQTHASFHPTTNVETHGFANMCHSEFFCEWCDGMVAGRVRTRHG